MKRPKNTAARIDRQARFLAAALELYQLDPARFEDTILRIERKEPH